MNLKGKNNQHLSIKNSRINSPIKPNHNLILSEDYSSQNRTFNINNNNTINPYSAVQRNNFILNPYKSSYDINNNNNNINNSNSNNYDIENNELEKTHENNILFKNLLLSPMTTFLSMTQKGPITLPSPILASGSTTAKG